MNENSKDKENQNTFSLEWCGCEMNFQKVAYVPELNHRLKNKGETREFGKIGFCGIWEILIEE